MTDPTDTNAHDFTADDADTSTAEGAARIDRAIADLVAGGADADLTRHLAALAWHQGWRAGWDERSGRSASHNPYDRVQS